MGADMRAAGGTRSLDGISTVDLGAKSSMTQTPKWETIGESVRGASHIRSNLRNQDAVRVELTGENRLPALLAVSDGHGSGKCFRSHEGSRLAVDAAIEILREFTAFVANECLPPAEIHRHAREQLPRKLWHAWREKVRTHYAEHPLTDEELGKLDEQTAATVKEITARDGPFVAYGATLVTALLGQAEWKSTSSQDKTSSEPAAGTDAAPAGDSAADDVNRGNYLLCLQLGDGEVLAISGDTHQVEQPIPPDADLIANETTSLCQDEAWKKFRVSFRYLLPDRTPPLVLLATDGYPNSFQTPEGFRQVAGDLLNLLERDNVEVVRRQLPGWLESASHQGSGDDVSVAILYYPRAPGERREPAARPSASSEPAVRPSESIEPENRPEFQVPTLATRLEETRRAIQRSIQTLRTCYVIAQRNFLVARRWFRRHPSAGLIATGVAAILALYSVIVSGCLLLTRASMTAP